MDSQILVAAQISSLFPSSSALTYIVSTKRNDLPLPPTSDTEHATAADVFYTEATGSILSRVVHDGQILELISLSTDAPPLRLIFPAPILPNPALVLGPQSIHILAVTTLGSLFRVVLPLFDGAPLWQASSLGSISVGEHIIAKLKGELRNAVANVHGIYCVVIGLEDGSLLRLEVERVGGENEAGAFFLLSSVFVPMNVPFARPLAGAGPPSQFFPELIHLIPLVFSPWELQDRVYCIPPATHRHRSRLDPFP